REAGLHLTPRQMFEHQTVAELAQSVEASPLAEAEQGVLVGPLALTPVQRAFFEWSLSTPQHFNQAVLLELKPEVESELLERAVGVLLWHHDALRLCFEQRNGEWAQSYGEPRERIPFSRKDLTGILEVEQRAALEADTALAQASLRLAEGELMRAVEYDLGAGERRLLLVIHHVAVDGVWWRILLEDIERVYRQLAGGEKPQLPAKTTSIRRWAERLEQYSRSTELRQEAEYWLSPCWENVRTALPVDNA